VSAEAPSRQTACHCPCSRGRGSSSDCRPRLLLRMRTSSSHPHRASSPPRSTKTRSKLHSCRVPRRRERASSNGPIETARRFGCMPPLTCSRRRAAPIGTYRLWGRASTPQGRLDVQPRTGNAALRGAALHGPSGGSLPIGQLHSDMSLLYSPKQQLHGVVHARFGEDTAPVASCGLERDAELGRNGTGGVAFADEPKDL
jgi:hypothetical protein